MSNPLIRPNDPRFQKPSIVDAQGQNRFAEGQAPPDEAGGESAAGAGSKPGDDVFAAGASDDERPYQPQYEATQQPRGGLLVTIASFGLAGAGIGVVSLTGLFDAGFVAPLICTAPAATAWLLAYEDLKAISQGAMDESGRPRTRLALWLGLFGMIACVTIVATMIWQQMNFLPDFF